MSIIIRLFIFSSIIVLILFNQTIAFADDVLYNWVKTNSASKASDNEIKKIMLDAKELSQLYNIDYILLLTIISTESSFNRKSVSDKGAIGLMQVMPTVWVGILRKNKIIKTKNDLYKIRQNIDAGCFVLSNYKKKYGSIEKALWAYNGKSYYYSRLIMKRYRKLRSNVCNDNEIIINRRKLK